MSALIVKASVRDFQHSLGPGHTSTMSCSLSLSIARPKDLAADRKLDLNGSLFTGSGCVDCFCFLPGFGPSAHSADGNSSTSSSSFCRSSGVFSSLFLLKVRFVASFRACKTQDRIQNWTWHFEDVCEKNNTCCLQIFEVKKWWALRWNYLDFLCLWFWSDFTRWCLKASIRWTGIFRFRRAVETEPVKTASSLVNFVCIQQALVMPKRLAFRAFSRCRCRTLFNFFIHRELANTTVRRSCPAFEKGKDGCGTSCLKFSLLCIGCRWYWYWCLATWLVTRSMALWRCAKRCILKMLWKTKSKIL